MKFLHLDVTSQQSVDAALKQFSSEQTHLDILVNNAGIVLEKIDDDPSTTTVQVLILTSFSIIP